VRLTFPGWNKRNTTLCSRSSNTGHSPVAVAAWPLQKNPPLRTSPPQLCAFFPPWSRIYRAASPKLATSWRMANDGCCWPKRGAWQSRSNHAGVVEQRQQEEPQFSEIRPVTVVVSRAEGVRGGNSAADGAAAAAAEAETRGLPEAPTYSCCPFGLLLMLLLLLLLAHGASGLSLCYNTSTVSSSWPSVWGAQGNPTSPSGETVKDETDGSTQKLSRFSVSQRPRGRRQTGSRGHTRAFVSPPRTHDAGGETAGISGGIVAAGGKAGTAPATASVFGRHRSSISTSPPERTTRTRRVCAQVPTVLEYSRNAWQLLLYPLPEGEQQTGLYWGRTLATISGIQW